MDSDGCRLGEEKSFELLYKIEWLTRTTLTTSLHPISTTDYILI